MLENGLLRFVIRFVTLINSLKRYSKNSVTVMETWRYTNLCHDHNNGNGNGHVNDDYNGKIVTLTLL